MLNKHTIGGIVKRAVKRVVETSNNINKITQFLKLRNIKKIFLKILFIIKINKAE
jgi:hypothetical protein